ncbi:hypothetical protein [Arthrobacter psychrochitiniphilus]|uniref:Uncharacterized protein n=1 Tax=Arthrobacter psychrochitiniphilus TaxID=291045 RepID=A0A2V3DR40_9MICC|nr:hypothetical protein [Arthrobacter psychrochitiniphilus]NYG17483.1 hypothetical protein [Arthrobacter psychrochitiniphilus]PXA64604.1 hypothetical protein CVS29_13645 [Arthrobacter psychrochitiniphilus]
MAITDYSIEAGRARTLRQQVHLNQLDYRRELSRLTSLGGTQREWARALGISQPSLSSALKTAGTVIAVRQGFSGADPYEVCQRYAVGQLTREQLIDELMRWDYVAPEKREHDYFDDLRFSTPGSFDDVGRAFNDRLLGGDLYDTILQAVAESRRCARDDSIPITG